MQRNVSGTDRTARSIAGAALLGGGLFTRQPRWRIAMLAVPAVALSTAVARYCPVNALDRQQRRLEPKVRSPPIAAI